MEKAPQIIHDALICSCSSTEHQIILSYIEPEDDPIIYVSIHLTPKSFWSRLLYAIKYLFGYKCQYGAFDEILLGPEHIDKLQAAINYLKSSQTE
jgi:hypothetical protein